MITPASALFTSSAPETLETPESPETAQALQNFLQVLTRLQAAPALLPDTEGATTPALARVLHRLTDAAFLQSSDVVFPDQDDQEQRALEAVLQALESLLAATNPSQPLLPPVQVAASQVPTELPQTVSDAVQGIPARPSTTGLPTSQPAPRTAFGNASSASAVLQTAVLQTAVLSTAALPQAQPIPLTTSLPLPVTAPTTLPAVAGSTEATQASPGSQQANGESAAPLPVSPRSLPGPPSTGFVAPQQSFSTVLQSPQPTAGAPGSAHRQFPEAPAAIVRALSGPSASIPDLTRALGQPLRVTEAATAAPTRGLLPTIPTGVAPDSRNSTAIPGRQTLPVTEVPTGNVQIQEHRPLPVADLPRQRLEVQPITLEPATVSTEAALRPPPSSQLPSAPKGQQIAAAAPTENAALQTTAVASAQTTEAAGILARPPVRPGTTVPALPRQDSATPQSIVPESVSQERPGPQLAASFTAQPRTEAHRETLPLPQTLQHTESPVVNQPAARPLVSSQLAASFTAQPGTEAHRETLPLPQTLQRTESPVVNQPAARPLVSSQLAASFTAQPGTEAHRETLPLPQTLQRTESPVVNQPAARPLAPSQLAALPTGAILSPSTAPTTPGDIPRPTAQPEATTLFSPGSQPIRPFADAPLASQVLPAATPPLPPTANVRSPALLQIPPAYQANSQPALPVAALPPAPATNSLLSESHSGIHPGASEPFVSQNVPRRPLPTNVGDPRPTTPPVRAPEPDYSDNIAVLPTGRPIPQAGVAPNHLAFPSRAASVDVQETPLSPSILPSPSALETTSAVTLENLVAQKAAAAASYTLQTSPVSLPTATPGVSSFLEVAELPQLSPGLHLAGAQDTSPRLNRISVASAALPSVSPELNVSPPAAVSTPAPVVVPPQVAAAPLTLEAGVTAPLAATTTVPPVSPHLITTSSTETTPVEAPPHTALPAPLRQAVAAPVGRPPLPPLPQNIPGEAPTLGEAGRPAPREAAVLPTSPSQQAPVVSSAPAPQQTPTATVLAPSSGVRTAQAESRAALSARPPVDTAETLPPVARPQQVFAAAVSTARTVQPPDGLAHRPEGASNRTVALAEPGLASQISRLPTQNPEPLLPTQAAENGLRPGTAVLTPAPAPVLPAPAAFTGPAVTEPSTVATLPQEGSSSPEAVSAPALPAATLRLEPTAVESQTATTFPQRGPTQTGEAPATTPFARTPVGQNQTLVTPVAQAPFHTPAPVASVPTEVAGNDATGQVNLPVPAETRQEPAVLHPFAGGTAVSQSMDRTAPAVAPTIPTLDVQAPQQPAGFPGRTSVEPTQAPPAAGTPIVPAPSAPVVSALAAVAPSPLPQPVRRTAGATPPGPRASQRDAVFGVTPAAAPQGEARLPRTAPLPTAAGSSALPQEAPADESVAAPPLSGVQAVTSRGLPSTNTVVGEISPDLPGRHIPRLIRQDDTPSTAGAASEGYAPLGAQDSFTATAPESETAPPPPPPLDLKNLQRLWERPGSPRSIVLQLEPRELGTVLVQVRLTDTGVVASFRAETAAARTLLHSHLPALQDALQQQGVSTQNLSVSLSSEGWYEPLHVPLPQEQGFASFGQGRNGEGYRRKKEQPETPQTLSSGEIFNQMVNMLI